MSITESIERVALKRHQLAMHRGETETEAAQCAVRYLQQLQAVWKDNAHIHARIHALIGAFQTVLPNGEARP